MLYIGFLSDSHILVISGASEPLALCFELVDEMEAWENECGNPEMEDFWGIVTRIRLLAENL